MAASSEYFTRLVESPNFLGARNQEAQIDLTLAASMAFREFCYKGCYPQCNYYISLELVPFAHTIGFDFLHAYCLNFLLCNLAFLSADELKILLTFSQNFTSSQQRNFIFSYIKGVVTPGTRPSATAKEVFAFISHHAGLKQSYLEFLQSD